MKTLKTISALILVLLSGINLLQAKIWTVDNKLHSAADFKKLQNATLAASDGDTIYIAGSTEVYQLSDGAFKQKLHFIGSGYKVDNQQNLSTKLTSFNLRHYPNQDINNCGSTFQGISFDEVRLNDLFQDAVVFNRCKFNTIEINGSTYERTSIRVTNCIFGRFGYYNEDDIVSIVVQNSIIQGRSTSKNEASSIIIDHCLFTDGILDVYYANVSNSIFWKTSNACKYTIFTNNLSNDSEFNFNSAENTGDGNIENTDPMFVKIDSVANAGFSYDYDYRLQAGSPGVNAATDGSNLGIY